MCSLYSMSRYDRANQVAVKDKELTIPGVESLNPVEPGLGNFGSSIQRRHL